MKFGLSAGLGIFAGNPDTVAPIVQKAEEVGFDAVFISDHLTVPAKVPDTYPYSDGGRAPFNPDSPWLDPIVLLSYIAGVTKKLKLGTAVYLLPLRNPHVTARSVVTLDRLSNGRVILGSGTGWMVDEFNAAQQDFDNRGARTVEIVEILKGLWTQDTFEYHGKFYDFGPLKFQPKPVQKPHPPIWFGGETPAALRRAARYGDGWIGMWYKGPEEAGAFVTKINALRKAEGKRDPFEYTVGYRGASLTPALARQYGDVGIHRLRLTPWGPESTTGPQILRTLEDFGNRVIAKSG